LLNSYRGGQKVPARVLASLIRSGHAHSPWQYFLDDPATLLAGRNHQGKDEAILFPATADRIGSSSGKIQTRECLSGLLKFYHREAA
jgi:hypothetical protein